MTADLDQLAAQVRRCIACPELAAARTQLARASQAVEIARAGVAQYVGVEPGRIEIFAPGLLRLPPEEC